ncbi:MAG: tRNA (adenosine(37)-N6)-dimethylallyltransferase MiaA [Magnetococcales bacterium]|nr:tRNA (adenosine(37)-N6)-dimethylallyltransferase MiaA [Magnetococcales bacterium]
MTRYHETPAKIPVLFLMGPTASGKSALALRLAATFPVEIVNADSVQIYRGMEIGTAKPTATERRMVPHHLLDVTEPDQPWSADRYREAAWETIHACHARGIVPLFVGGSGLYLRAVEQGLVVTPPVAGEVLAAIRERAGRHGWPHVHQELLRVDPESAARITPGDGQRILRALGVHAATGIPLSQWRRHQPPPPPFEVLKLAIDTPRAILYPRIDARFDRMVRDGLPQEAQGLLEKNYDRELPAMKAVGYRQIFPCLEGKRTLQEATADGRLASRHYAKRQETWLKQEHNLLRLTGEDPLPEAIAHVGPFLACRLPGRGYTVQQD